MNEQTLEDRLTEEAAQHSPAFSPSLHNRIMHRITNAPATGLHARRINRFRPLAIAAAAALVTGTSMLLHHTQPRPTNPGGTVALRTVPSLPGIPNPVQALDGPIASEWTTARYAYLDRDGEKLLGYVSRQLDFMPRRQ